MGKSFPAVLSILFLFLISLSRPVESQALAAPAQGDAATQVLIDKYRQLVPQIMREKNIPGMAIAIVDDTHVVWAEGFGYTDWDRKQPVTPDTPFSIQSMSKSFTAAAVMQSVQEGLVDLDTPISTYLPDFHVNSIFESNPQDKITLRHLLSHTAGFTHDAPVGNNNDLDPGTWQEHIASISDTWLLFPVGSRYSYGNNAIDLAGYIVEVRSGMPFQEYVKTHLLDPLGMNHSTMDIDTIQALPDKAIGHSVTPKLPLVQMMPSGGMYSTANDMARYLLFYLNLGKANAGQTGESQVLSADLVKCMYQGQFPASAKTGYGLGLAYSRMHDVTNTLQINHGGGGFGFLSDMTWFPQIKFGVAWMTNSSEHDLQDWFTGQLAGDYIAANQPVLASRINQSPSFTQKTFGSQDPLILTDKALAELIQSMAIEPTASNAGHLKAYTGTYGVKTWGRTMELHKVALQDGSLTLDGERLTEVQPGLFFLDNGEVLNLGGPISYYRNTQLEKVGQGTVIFYTLFVSICALACLVLLVLPLARWIWHKVRHTAPTPRPTWQQKVGRVFIFLAALAGLAVFATLALYPSLVLDGIWFPKRGTPTLYYVFLLSPYILLGLTLLAALFTGLGWKGRAGWNRWFDVGTIGLLAAYALVVI